MKLLCYSINRLKNAFKARKSHFVLKKSSFCLSIFSILFKKGFISDLKIIRNSRSLKIALKKNITTILPFREIKLISKPSKMVYVRYRTLSKISSAGGELFISTKHGVLSLQECLQQKIGGVCLFYII
jgi:small subunit ribosomal protein S8